MKLLKIILIMLIATGCTKTKGVEETNPFVPQDTPTINSVKPKPKEVTISSVGDILIHDTVYKAAQTGSNSYDFKPMFKAVMPYLSKSDLTIGNLEVPVAGKGYMPSSYPSFNSPIELLDALKWAGFDVLTNANNHALDRGYQALINTIDNMNKYKFMHTGTNKNQKHQPLIFEKNGIKFGVYAYTYGTNGIPQPKANPKAVNVIDQKQMLDDIAYLKKQDVDVIIGSLHFGVEYQTQSNQDQQALVKTLIMNGTDLILGSHPHVLQEYQMMKYRDSKGHYYQAPVIFSQGNFMADQATLGYTDISAIFNFKVTVDQDLVEVDLIDYVPLWMDKKLASNKRYLRVLPVDDAIKNYQNKTDKDLSSSDYQSLLKAKKDIKKLIGF